MKVIFAYDEGKDVWCLLNKGKSSNNSSVPTRVYEQLVARCGEDPTLEMVEGFVRAYIAEKGIDVQEHIRKYQQDWDTVAGEYQQRAEALFGVSLPRDIHAYLTVNNRRPYNIKNDFFFVTVPVFYPRKIAMHELWHFYTWYGLGPDEEQRLGALKYNDLKESLTVLLNVECKDLMPEGAYDEGYPQHQDIREKILNFWTREKSITKLWDYLGALSSEAYGAV